MRSIWPFMAFFRIMSTVSMRLISLVPSKMRLMRASRVAALHARLGGVAHAAKDLHGLVDDEVEHL